MTMTLPKVMTNLPPKADIPTKWLPVWSDAAGLFEMRSGTHSVYTYLYIVVTFKTAPLRKLCIRLYAKHFRRFRRLLVMHFPHDSGKCVTVLVLVWVLCAQWNASFDIVNALAVGGDRDEYRFSGCVFGLVSLKPDQQQQDYDTKCRSGNVVAGWSGGWCKYYICFRMRFVGGI